MEALGPVAPTAIQSMLVEPYCTCQHCGAALETETMYRHHAYCVECTPTIAG